MAEIQDKAAPRIQHSSRPETRPNAGGALTVPKGKPFSIKVSVTPGANWVDEAGYDVSWVRVYFVPDRDSTAYEVGSFELAGGEDNSPVTTGQSVVFGMRISDSGELLVMTYSLAEGLVLNRRRFELHD